MVGIGPYLSFRMKALRWILSPVRTLLAILHTLVCSLIGLLAMAINSNGGDWVMWNVGRRLWSWPLLRYVIGCDIQVDVHPETDQLAGIGQGLVLVANHTSFLDINAAFVASPTPIVFLSKASVRKVPLLGKLNELAGTVFVERGNRASSEEAISALTETLKQGRSVLVFPEGTRSKQGNLQPFKKGAFHLASAANAKVVPMHISGTWDILPPSAFLFCPSTRLISIQVGKPLDISDGSAAEIAEEAHRRVRELAACHP